MDRMVAMVLVAVGAWCLASVALASLCVLLFRGAASGSRPERSRSAR